MTDELDLPPRYREQLEALLRKYVPGAEVWAYGSRIRNRSHAGSDLDLVLLGPGLERLGDGYYDLLDAIEQSNIPILIQVHDWARLPESFHREIGRNYVVIQSGLRPDEDNRASQQRRVSLDDVIDLRLSSVDKKSKVNEYPVRLCNYMDVYNNSFIHSDMDFMNATATEREIEKCSLVAGDVVITKDSEKHDDIGVPALVKGNIPNLVCGYHLAILRPRSSEINGSYLFYALSTDETQQQFHSYANGITRFGLRKSDIGLVEIPLPPLPEQRAIAHILGTLDDKIELNQRMNETLETMAQALFKSWFIDFDPVRAKIEGRDTGLPQRIADLFPDRMVDSELGEIPEGWEAGVLDDVVELFSGGTPRTSVIEYWDGNIPWYTAKDSPPLSDVFVLETERSITPAGVENSATKILPAQTTIITARGTVGRLACLGIPMAMNQTCYGIRGADGYTDFFTYWVVRAAINELQRRTHGTIFDTITRQTFKYIETTLVPIDLVKEFEAMVKPLMTCILKNLNETRILTTLRDALLPKMVSGDLRVGINNDAV